MPTPDRHRDDYDPEPDFDKPTRAEAEADERGLEAPERPVCEGCGKRVFTETEVVIYDEDGMPWHDWCWEEASIECRSLPN
jgi:hypothetical protein